MKKLIVASLTFTLVMSLSFIAWGQTSQSAPEESAKNPTLKGEITNILWPLATLKAGDKEYTVHLGCGPRWNEADFGLEKGEVEITGTTEEIDGQWHLFPGKLVQGEKTLILTSNKGSAKYCGKGAGHGRGGHHQKCCGGGGCKRGK